MTTGETIFGLRFKSNPEFLPSRAELDDFLSSPKQAGGPGLHRDDLAQYRQLLTDVREFDLRRQSGGDQANFEKKILFSVLSHSHFVRPELLSAVEQYKYQLHTLAALDFTKPTAFIKSAEQEIAKLNPKRKEDAARLQRFQGMVDARKQVLDALTRRWSALVTELGHLVQYLRENLGHIEKLCEASIVFLVSEQIDRKKQIVLIEDIKTHIKERLRESLRQGTITKDQLDAAKEEAAVLSKRTADLLRSDVYALSVLYEAIHGHIRNIALELDTLVAQISATRTDLEKDKMLFDKIGQVLLSLITDYRLKLQSAEIPLETEPDIILFEKRKEMFDHLFDLLQNRRSS
jgi:hypothetical protein